jgi:catechol 2,3-dioxygenase-like lactoylglutathione lyase family enzyme
MITKLSHVTLFVNNQDEAKNFYVNTLGFEVRTDHTMDGGFRWLTVGPKTQKDVEIVLMEPKPGPMLDDEAAKAVRLLPRRACWDQASSRSTIAVAPTRSSRPRACSSPVRPKTASTASKRS